MHAFSWNAGKCVHFQWKTLPSGVTFIIFAFLLGLSRKRPLLEASPISENLSLADAGGATDACPLRVQILSLWHTNFLKCSRLGSWHPAMRWAPPYGKSWTRHCLCFAFSVENARIFLKMQENARIFERPLPARVIFWLQCFHVQTLYFIF